MNRDFSDMDERIAQEIEYIRQERRMNRIEWVLLIVASVCIAAGAIILTMWS